MPCFHPRKGFQIGITENGKPKFRIEPWETEYCEKTKEGWKGFDCCPPARRISLGAEYQSGLVVNFIPIPCGNCLGCRLDYAKQWSVRLQHEFQMHPEDECWFLTLTYNDDALAETFLPSKPPIDRLVLGADHLGESCWFPNLYPRDMTLFWKRLRKHFPDSKIMYYQAGEYGERRGRCHWHAIVFGVPLDRSQFHLNGVSELGDVTWRSDELEKLWHSTLDETMPLGNVIVGKVTAKSCGYVARYTLKKAREMWEYDYSNRVRPLVRMSTNPAIGKGYIETHPELFDVSQFYISNGSNSFLANHPRYYMKYLSMSDPVRFEELKASRSDAGKISFENLMKDGRPYLEILRAKELDFISRCAKMKRKVD